MRVLITGAAGFVGSRLVGRILQHAAFAQASVTLSDTEFKADYSDRRVRIFPGDLRSEAVRERLLADKPELVFHLAGILGGAAESHYRIAREINIDATLAIFEALRDRLAPPRIVFTSSIAVFGPLPSDVPVTDETRPTPLMVYGGQKHMMETALEHFSARGELDGIGLRLPGIVARSDADERMKSSFLHRLFHAYKSGQAITLPVSSNGTSWLISVPACIDALIHAALLPGGWCGGRRVFTLPAQRVSMSALIEGLAAQFPTSHSIVGFAPELELEAQFARQPPLTTTLADQLGFKHDGTIRTLIVRALEH